MSEPSPSASTSAIVGSPSTTLASFGGKRKASSDDLPPSSPSPPSPSANETQDFAAKNDNLGDEVEQPVKKRVRKPLEKLVPVWKDLKQWKEGDDPLARFPVEVLDLIISVNSDLDGVRREKRGSFETISLLLELVVTSGLAIETVLYQAAFPAIRSSSFGFGASKETGEFHGPFQRSFNDGRHIFSSGRSLVGAGGWAGWGLARGDFVRTSLDSSNKCEALQILLDQHLDERPLELTEEENSSIAREWSRTSLPRALKEEMKQQQIKTYMARHMKNRRNDRYALQDVYGLLPKWMQQEKATIWTRTTNLVYEYSKYPPELHDPWPSHWRGRIAEIVLAPRVDRKEAKEVYKLTDRELLGLKELPAVYGTKSTKYYYKAAIEALSLRSHGGVKGHEQHVVKVEARRLKAMATREKNNALLGKKSKATAQREKKAAETAARQAQWDGHSMYDSDDSN